MLSVLVQLSSPKVTEAGRPGGVIGTHSGVEVANGWDAANGGAEVVVEPALGLSGGSQRLRVGADQTDWTGAGEELGRQDPLAAFRGWSDGL